MKREIIAQITELLQHTYGLSEPLVEIPEDGIEGNAYLITAKKMRYVAKVYTSLMQANTLANYQNAVHTAGAPVPVITKTLASELVATISGLHIVVCEFAHGNPIGWRNEFAKIPAILSRDIAQALAKMHQVNQNLSETKIAHSLSAVDHLSDFLHDNTLKSVRQTMIHGDLTRENVFVDSATSKLTAIIDFGDAHHDYITYDIATALTQIYVTKSWGIDFEGIKDFLRVYTECNGLTSNERQTILPLMTFRNMILLREIEQKLTQRDDREDLESIQHSLQTKLDLLQEHRSRIGSILKTAS